MQQKNDLIQLYGLVGYPLSHSFSQKYFRQKFINESIEGADFINFELDDISKIRQLALEYPLLKGFSVTIPYKEKIIPYLDEINEDVKAIGAVNAVKCNRTENSLYLKGFNTDYIGFKTSLSSYLTGKEKNALVLGFGGASKAVIYALDQSGINSLVVSRSKQKLENQILYNQVSEVIIQSSDIIINTTPLGMWPNIDTFPDIPYHFIREGTIAFDLVYNPLKTKFLSLCENFGAVVVNGIEMLQLQAEESWMYFNC